MSLLPWLIIPFILYNIIAFFILPADLRVHEYLNQDLFSIQMYSGGQFDFSIGDAILLITLLMMFIEILKATRTGPISMLDHSLSMILFIICLLEFLMRPEAATAVFFLITVATLIDVIAGFIITISGARRDMGVN